MVMLGREKVEREHGIRYLLTERLAVDDTLFDLHIETLDLYSEAHSTVGVDFSQAMTQKHDLSRIQTPEFDGGIPGRTGHRRQQFSGEKVLGDRAMTAGTRSSSYYCGGYHCQYYINLNHWNALNEKRRSSTKGRKSPLKENN